MWVVFRKNVNANVPKKLKETFFFNVLFAKISKYYSGPNLLGKCSYTILLSKYVPRFLSPPPPPIAFTAFSKQPMGHLFQLVHHSHFIP